LLTSGFSVFFLAAPWTISQKFPKIWKSIFEISELIARSSTLLSQPLLTIAMHGDSVVTWMNQEVLDHINVA